MLKGFILGGWKRGGREREVIFWFCILCIFMLLTPLRCLNFFYWGMGVKWDMYGRK